MHFENISILSDDNLELLALMFDIFKDSNQLEQYGVLVAEMISIAWYLVIKVWQFREKESTVI